MHTCRVFTHTSKYAELHYGPQLGGGGVTGTGGPGFTLHSHGAAVVEPLGVFCKKWKLHPAVAPFYTINRPQVSMPFDLCLLFLFGPAFIRSALYFIKV